MSRVSAWIGAARPKTLPASIGPVLLGTGSAGGIGKFEPVSFILCLLVAISVQIAANLSNDYSDGVRGTDDENRVGPQRLTGAGIVAPAVVRRAAFVMYGLTAVFGLVLTWWSGVWMLLPIGVLAFLASWFYVGGRHPYGYFPGIAEVMVFIFFGLVATCATTYTQAHVLSWRVLLAAAGIGMLSCALLMTNNLRDRVNDERVGKDTLSVRLGDLGSRKMLELELTLGCVAAVVALPTFLGKCVAACLAIVALFVNLPVTRGADGMELFRVLRNIGLFTLLYGAAVGAGFLLP